MKEFEILSGLLKKDRSVRRFREDDRLTDSTMKQLVELCRYCASGRNLQPLKYRIVTGKEECEQVYPLLKWAGYYTDWDGPEKGERPAAYLIQCLDTDMTKNPMCDEGLQLQAITLGATAVGLGCCIIKSFDVKGLMRILSLPDNLIPSYVLALGKPVETVKIEDMDGTPSADFKYFRTADGVHHVPKRPLEEIIIS